MTPLEMLTLRDAAAERLTGPVLRRSQDWRPFSRAMASQRTGNRSPQLVPNRN